MPELAPVMISGIALVVSVIVFVDNRLRAQEASRLARVPMLAFTWEPLSGWTLTNIGSGPALDVVIVQLTGGEWKYPLRMPELAVKDSDLVPMGWIRWEENPGLGARYRSITGERYMTKTSHDWSRHSRGWGDMPDALWDELEPHWRYPVDVPPAADPRIPERDEPHRAIVSRGKRLGLGGSRLRIMVSYRRADKYFARPFIDALSARFGNVFNDSEFDASAAEPAEVVDRVLGSANVVIVLIGRAWLEAGADGRRRLDDPNDSVRLEIDGALRRGITVVPVLVDGARMPTTQELPASLAPFASLQPLELSGEAWGHDAIFAELASYIS